MEIVGEYQDMDADKDIWKYFRDYWLCLFPKLPSRSSFVRQVALLVAIQTRATAKISS